jgi:Spy/CpxP family protein refolding chaperone
MSNADKPLREKMKGSTTPEERMDLRKQMMNNRKTFDTEVDTFLTPDQKTKRSELKAKRKSEHHKKGKHHAPAPAGENK